ncbi:hypothetical protein, partial [Streptomyces sp. HNM0574]|uniref:hypothetical protein n=1 Tax=Streptomyces sp. HNM0574 TaxID=2714954 RepID=UPI0016AF6828
AERVVDAATACAVRLHHGGPQPGTAAGLLRALDTAAEGLGGRRPVPGGGTYAPLLDTVAARLHRAGTAGPVGAADGR